ncbi:phosphatase and actin regulator 2 isoform X2 [Tiliqua scincoides]|uniref:phosphatase and actin regulator 2 isoform X2 n=1 Tax=Tiliqua scincoides TaxID=71010 RepID=UPI003462A31D
MGQTSVSTLSEQASVDGIDKASIANSDGPTTGSRTPPFKRKGKLSSIGKIFKPWKWRKKKSEKFIETSAVLERKISTRQSREELIRRGVLKEIIEQDGEVTVNYEISNGHTVVIGEEAIQEENIKTAEDSSSRAAKARSPEERKEGRKASSSHVKKVQGSKSSSSSPSTTSSRPKTSKELASSKASTGAPKDKKKVGKQVTTRTPADGDISSASNKAGAGHSETKMDNSKPEEPLRIIPEAESTNQQSTVFVPPPPPSVPPPLPPSIPSPSPSPGSQPTGFSDTQDVPVSTEIDPSVPGTVSNDLHTNTEADSKNSSGSADLDNNLDIGGEDTECSVTKEDQEEESFDLASPASTDDPSESFNTPESESSKENHTSDSDSDGPILYTDDDDDDDDASSLASKIRRRDTLAIKLGNRPSKKELEDKNILQRTSEEERQEIRHQIGTKLVRRLSQRPTSEELEQRNILRQKNEEEEQEAKRELKRSLSRKLSLRPTVAELQARRILRFNEYVEVTDSPDYDRRADKPWARLTPADKAAIRKELNEFKSMEMEVHEESRQFTRFHRP